MEKSREAVTLPVAVHINGVEFRLVYREGVSYAVYLSASGEALEVGR